MCEAFLIRLCFVDSACWHTAYVPLASVTKLAAITMLLHILVELLATPRASPARPEFASVHMHSWLGLDVLAGVCAKIGNG
jgi:hypothetical protein